MLSLQKIYFSKFKAIPEKLDKGFFLSEKRKDN